MRVKKELHFTLNEISQIVAEHLKQTEEIHIYTGLEPYFDHDGKLNFVYRGV